MIVVTGSVTARKESFDEVRELSLEQCVARAPSPDASPTPCMSIAKIRCGWCSSSNGPIAPRCWRISRCRPRAISSARCNRSPISATTIELYDATRLERL